MAISRRGFLIGAQAGGLLAGGSWSLAAHDLVPERAPVEGGVTVHLVLEGGLDALSVLFPSDVPALLGRRPSFGPLYRNGRAATGGWSVNELMPQLHRRFMEGQVAIGLDAVNVEPSHVNGLQSLQRDLYGRACEESPAVIAPVGASCADWVACRRVRTADPSLAGLPLWRLCDLIATTPAANVIVALTGFDWHHEAVDQALRRLPALDRIFNAVIGGLRSSGRWDESTVEVRSELARGVMENWRGGVDHGEVGFTLRAGGQIRGGIRISSAVEEMVG
jgi:uncharacterized protein (DUF1501 family)